MISLQFVLTSLLIILVPGTGVIFTVSTGLSRGPRASIVAAFGCTLGIVPHLLAGVFGLSAVLYMSSLAFRLLKYAGVAYLLFLAWQLWKSSGSFSMDGQTAPESGSRVVLRAILINLLNPKLTLFFFAFLPQFLPTGSQRPALDMSLLGFAFMAMTAAVFIGYGILAASVRSLVEERSRVLGGVQKGFSGLLALLALRLALAAED